MPQLYGRKVTRGQLLQRVGKIEQVGGVRRYTLSEGREKGVEVIQFRTGTGFAFEVLPGRGMDIGLAEHCGRALAWYSATGVGSPELFDNRGLAWLRSFFGGLVTTCGLSSAGAPTLDVLPQDEEAVVAKLKEAMLGETDADGLARALAAYRIMEQQGATGDLLGLHGRVSNTRATNVCADGEWDGDDYVMYASGKVREAVVFRENIVLHRKVTARLGENRLTIEDSVTNESHHTVPHAMLYHINGGFPAIDAGARLVSPTRKATPRDEAAVTEADRYAEVLPPTSEFAERCYYHDIAADADGFAMAALVNPGLAFGFYVRYRQDTLPVFNEWKQCGEGDYVIGLEPANCGVEGREIDRARGDLQFLEPAETRDYFVEIGVLDGADEVNAFEVKAKAALG